MLTQKDLVKNRETLERLRTIYLGMDRGHLMTAEEAQAAGTPQLTKSKLALYIRRLDWEISRASPSSMTNEQLQILTDKE